MTDRSQNGYEVIPKLENCKVYSVPGTTVTLPLRDDDTALLLVMFIAEWNILVEPLNKTDCHGYNKRRIGGSDEWSNHASATAADLNATKHKQGVRGTFTKSQVEAIRKLLAKYQVIKWGGDYRTTVDEMHVEINAPIQEVKAVYASLKKAATPAPQVSISLKNAIKAAKTGDGHPTAAKKIQKALVAKGYGAFNPTGFYGPLTLAAYAAFQRSLGYVGKDADGIPGRKSLEKLGFKVSE